MQSTALAEAMAAGRRAFPLLKVEWSARGLDLGTDLCAPSSGRTSLGQITRVTKPGGWDPIDLGAGINGGTVKPVETSVAVSDIDGSLLQMLDTYNPRGSAASISVATTTLMEVDWEPLFQGIVADWAADEPFTRLLLKTDDSVLRSPVPLPVFDRTIWGAADDSTIYGVHLPLILGVHDAYTITARGMVPGVNVRFDKDLGYWWLVSIGNLVDVRRLYYDGVPITTGKGSWWHIRREVVGSTLITAVEIDEGYQPIEDTVVAFDVEGPDSNGDFAGSTLENPVQQLRAILEEYVYRPAPLGIWRGAHSIIDNASWTAAATYFSTRGYVSGRRLGADQGETSAAAVIQSFLDAYPWTRIDWGEMGSLVFTIIDTDDADPDESNWLDLREHHEGRRVPYGRGDRREVYSQIDQPFAYSGQEQKFLSSYSALDPAAVDVTESPSLPIENPWSLTEFATE